MNTKLIALAIAALPAAAIADTTIYGRFVAGLEHDSAKNYAGNSLSENGVNDYLSWIGFKGQEDVGNGMKALWQVETALAIDGTSVPAHNSDASNAWATRATFVGLQGDFGRVRLGKMENAQRDMFDVDKWNNASGANALDIFKRIAYRPNNAIRYDSPNLAGFSGSLMWAAGENKDAANSKASNLLNFGLNYRNAGYFFQYGYDKRTLSHGGFGSTPGSEDSKAHTIEAGYKANGLLVSLGLQRATNWEWDDRGYKNETAGFAEGTNNLRTKEAALTVAYDIGAFTPKLSYAKGWDMKDSAGKIDDSGYRQFILGVDYRLSKRSKVTLSHGRLDTGANAGGAVGNGYNAEGGAGQNLSGDLKRQSTTAVSIEHWF